MSFIQKCVRISRPPGASGICPLTGARVPLTHPERPGCAMWGLLSVPRRGRASCSMAGHIKTPGRTALALPCGPVGVYGGPSSTPTHISIHVPRMEDDSGCKMVAAISHFYYTMVFGVCCLIFFSEFAACPPGQIKRHAAYPQKCRMTLRTITYTRMMVRTLFIFLPPLACKAQNL